MAGGIFLLSMILLFRLIVICGTAYVVFWKDASGWWFLLAVLLCAGGGDDSKDLDTDNPREHK